jgi:hypothetical protein
MTPNFFLTLFVIVPFAMPILYAQQQAPALLQNSFICTQCESGGGGGGGAAVTCDDTKTALYVDASRTVTTGNGYSWATAKKTLHAALYIANRCPNIKSIYVAEGVYTASTTASLANRDNNFFVGSSYSIYGGFAPGGAGGIRDHVNNPTILDGEIADGFEAYHVLVIYGQAEPISIEGFQIKNGFADGSGSIELQPGVNMPRTHGAGIYIRDAAQVTFRNCAIYQNVASGNGGGIFNSNSNLTLVNTVLANNSAVDGGGLQNIAGSVANLINSTLGGNTAVGGGGAAYSTTGTELNVTNTIAWGNTSLWGGGGTKSVNFSLLQSGVGDLNCININPGFNNPADLNGADNKWFTSDDGLNIPFCSPAVNRGNNDASPSPSTDIKGDTRKFNVQIDMGAYENQSIPFPLSGAHRSIDGDEIENYVWGGVTAFGVTGCRIIANVEPNGANPVQGKIRAKTFVETVDDLTYYGLPLVRRHYDFVLTPTNNNATARVTLFFSNTDFLGYNQRGDAVGSMPITDGSNKESLRVIQRMGTSDDGSPGSYYVDGATIIDPDDMDIVWSQTTTNWRVSFNTTRPESGFFLAAIAKYRFIGNGNWTDPNNWEGGRIPPAILPGFCEITIANNSVCTLNIEQRLRKEGQLIVQPNAHLIIQGGLSINPINPR